MTNKQYQSEDMEMLLMQKEFSELLPEEKAFVLTHLEDEEEYKRMRNLLYQFIEIEKLPTDGPDERVKKSLDALFQKEKKGNGIRYMTWLWLSSGIAAIFILGYFYFPNSSKMTEPVALAENKIKVEPLPHPSNEIQKNTIKKAPPKINTIEFTSIELTEEVTSTNEDAPNISDVILSSPDSGPAADLHMNLKTPEEAESMTSTSVEKIENAYVEFPPYYPGGESKLIQDVQTILQNHWIKRPETLEKKNNTTPKVPSKLIFKFHVNANGKVDDVQLVKSKPLDQEQITLWCNKLINELKTFELKNNGVAGFFVLPINIDLD